MGGTRRFFKKPGTKIPGSDNLAVRGRVEQDKVLFRRKKSTGEHMIRTFVPREKESQCVL